MRGHVRIERDLIGLVTTPPPPLAIASMVDDDAINPRLQGRLTAELVNRAEDVEEDVLRQVRGFVPVTEHVVRELKHHPLVTRDQFGTRRLFTGGTALDERGLAGAYIRP